MHDRIDNFIQTSRNNSIFFENFLKWDEYTFDPRDIWKIWYIDEELLSIYWTDEYLKLSELQKKHLSYLELCQIFYVYAFCESILCLFMAREIPKYSLWNPVHDFLVREQIEEYRHQDMFVRMLHLLQSWHTEIGSFWRWTMRMEAKLLPSKYFFVIQTAIELLTSDFWVKCSKNIELYSWIRDIAQIHEIEEARHIAFAKIMLDDYFWNSSFITRSIGWFVIIIDVLLVNKHYIWEENFKKLGIPNSKYLFQLAKKNWKNNKLKNFSSEKWMDFLRRYWFITWVNRWAFKLFLWFKI